jgi:type IV pilus assembly protein PilC
MPAFEYTAKDASGNTTVGCYENISDVAMLRAELARIGYTLLKARKKKAALRKTAGKVAQAEVVAFAYKFAGMYSASLSITRCLEILAEQTDNLSFKMTLTDIRQQVENGSSLKGAFEKHKNVFSDFFIGMLEAGETGGKLSTTLNMAAAYMEAQLELKRKVKSAFAYPIIVGIMCFVIVGYLVTCVVPIFAKLYKQLHVALPGPTQTLVIISEAVSHYWWLILLCVAGIISLYRVLRDNQTLKRKLDEIKLNMPIFGKLNRMVVVSRFMRTFAMMIEAGIPLIEALTVANRVANNYSMDGITEKIQNSISSGSSIASPLNQCDIFPPMIVQMIAAGEEAGMLSEMLSKGVELLDKDIDRTIKSLLVKLEPALTLLMGTIVGFILLGLYLPMFDYMSHLK